MLIEKPEVGKKIEITVGKDVCKAPNAQILSKCSPLC